MTTTTITGSQANYTFAGAGITLFNNGTITGSVSSGFQTDSVINSGRIAGGTSTGSGVIFTAGGAVTNQTSAFIGGYKGISGSGAAVGILNAGTISGATTASGIGIDLAVGGTLTNQAPGLILGSTGMTVRGGAAAIDNAGTIRGTGGSLATAVSLAAGFQNQVTAEVGGAFLGLVDGGNTIGASAVSTLILAAGTATGQLPGLGTSIVNFAQITVAAGGAWVLTGNGTLANGATLTNNGAAYAALGSFANAGAVLQGIRLADQGTINNQASGTITGQVGVYGKLGTSTLINAGRIAGNATAGVGVLVAGSSTVTVTNQSGGSIAGFTGLSALGVAAAVTNAGQIAGDTATGKGVAFAGGGGLTNQSGGTIAGSLAVYGRNAAMTIVNAGSLSGLASIGGAGVSLSGGGLVSNQTGGQISGFRGIYAATIAATVTNAGRIVGDTAAGYGVLLAAGGALANAAGGTIAGHTGLDARSAVSVTNAGGIAGDTASSGSGIRLAQGGTVSNQTGGTISGLYGIRASGASIAVVNAGVIGLTTTAGVGVQVSSGGALSNQSGGTIAGVRGVYAFGTAFTVVNAGQITSQTVGVSLAVGGQVVNQAGGTIQGGTAIAITGGAGTVSAAGRIMGTAGAAVSFAPGFANRMILNAGATILSAVDGGNTIGATAVSTLELASSASAGTLSGIGSTFTHFGQIVVDSGASWSLAAQNTVANGVTVTNGGTLVETGALTNAGSIGGGLTVGTGGLITNLSTGTISGPAAITGKGIGVSVVNQGVIAGATTAGGGGIVLGSGGTVTNQTGGAISGLYGIYSQNGAAAIVNAGGIAGAAGAGVLLNAGGTLTNQAGGAISGAAGVRALHAAATLSNAGAISGAGGTAVAMAAGYAQRVVVTPGAVFGGLVDGGNTIGASASSTLELAAGAGAGTVTNLSSSFVNFNQIVLDGGAQWNFTGAGTIGNGVTFTNSGAVSGTIANSGLIQNGLAFAGGLYAVNGVTGTITGTVGLQGSGGAGTVVNSGSIVGSGGTAVSLPAGFANRLVVAPGAVFTGIARGGDTAGSSVVSTLELTSAAATGTLSGLGSQFLGFNRVQIDAGAAWTLNGANTIAAGTTLNVGSGASLSSGGTLVAAGSVVNAGAIQQGLSAGANGFVTNQSGGTIAGKIAVGGTAAGIGLANHGVIQGATTAGGFGVSLRSGGLVTNQSGGTVTARTAIAAVTGALTLTNGGTISGYGLTGLGVSMSAGGQILNQSYAIISGATAVRIGAAAANVQNAGTIIGASVGGRGVDFQFGGGYLFNQSQASIQAETGVRFYASAGTITNLGTISGSGGTAVSMAAGYTNLVQIAGGAVFGGLVDGGNAPGGTAVSTLRLISDSGDGTLSGLGSGFVNFGGLEIDTSARWTLTGTNLLASGQTLLNNGTLLLAATSIVSDVLLGKGKVTLLNGGGLTVGGTVASGETIGLDGTGVGLVLTAPNKMSGTVVSFGVDDTIDLAGVAPDSVYFSGGSLHFNYGYRFAMSLVGGTNVSAVTDGAGGALLSVACFAAGTRIATASGFAPVETLAAGDRIALAAGGFAPAVWIGRRAVDCARHPDPPRVWPVRVRAGAFGPGVPVRDLYLSPDHAIFLDGVLIPVRLLIDGTAISQEPRDKVTYFHVEVPEHAVILAEGLPVESFLPAGDKSDFEGTMPMRLFPTFAPMRVAAVWETRGAAPLVSHGAALEKARASLAARAVNMPRGGPVRPENRRAGGGAGERT